jgi:short-subunit dehydrogenase
VSRALITGGSAGIGAAFAARLAADGHDIILVARDPERLRSTAVALRRDHGVTVTVIPADLTLSADRALVERRLAEKPVDVLVNSAGFEAEGEFPQVARDLAQAEVELNITAVLRLTHAALPGMIARNTGTVINLGSVAGFLPPAGSSYGPTKAWVAAFTDSVASTLTGTGVRAIAVCPGYVNTGWNGHHGAPGLAGLLLWLTPEQVVAGCFADLARGRVVCAPGVVYRPLVAALELPRTMLRGAARLAGRSRQQKQVRARATQPAPAPPPTPVERVRLQRAARQEPQRVDLPGCTRAGEPAADVPVH